VGWTRGNLIIKEREREEKREENFNIFYNQIESEKMAAGEKWRIS